MRKRIKPLKKKIGWSGDDQVRVEPSQEDLISKINEMIGVINESADGGILDSEFIFQKWRTGPTEELIAETFTSSLDAFGEFNIYSGFLDFLEDHESMLYHPETGLHDSPLSIVQSSERFNTFVTEHMNLAIDHPIGFEDRNCIIAHGMIDSKISNMQPVHHFLVFDEEKSSVDIMDFANDVLHECGIAAQGEDVRPIYEITGIHH